MSETKNKFSPGNHEPAVRQVLDNEGQHASRWLAVMSISARIGYTPQTLNDRFKKAEVDSGKRAGEPLTAPGEEYPSQGVRVFCDGAARPPDHRRASECARGRADLQRAADRPVHLL